MKTHAGDLYIELSGDWDDDSQYVYRDGETDIEIRVEPSPVDELATPEILIEPMIERLELLGPLENLTRGTREIQERPGATLSVVCQREGDPEATLMEVLIFKTTPSRAITVTALAPRDQHASLAEAWEELLVKMRIIDIG